MTYKENLRHIEDNLLSAIDGIKTILLEDHPAKSGDKLIKATDEITKARHIILDLMNKD